MLLKLARHRLFKDTLVMLGVQVSGYIIPLITLPYLTRVLGPANFGLVALGSAFAVYFYVVVEYGFAVTGTREVARAEGDIDEVSRVYSSIMACKLISLTACFLVLCGCLLAVPKLREHWPLYLVSYMQVIGWGLSPNWLLQGVQRMKLIAYSDYGAKIVSVLLIFVLVRNSSQYITAAALQSGGFVISALIGLWLAFRHVGIRVVRPTWADMRQALIVGWPVFLSMASLVFISSTNTILLGMLTGPEQVGFFSAAQRLMIATRALTNPISAAVYPYMSRMAIKSPGEAVAFVRRGVLWTAAPFLVISVGLFVLGPMVSHILYGPKYAETGILLQLMSPTPVVHAISMCFGTYYMLAFGFEKQWNRIVTRVMIMNFVLIGIMVLFMRPVRALALSSALLDIFSATSAYLFYRKTSNTVAARLEVQTEQQAATR